MLFVTRCVTGMEKGWLPRQIHPFLPSREAIGRAMFSKRQGLRAGWGIFTFLGGRIGGQGK